MKPYILHFTYPVFPGLKFITVIENYVECHQDCEDDIEATESVHGAKFPFIDDIKPHREQEDPRYGVQDDFHYQQPKVGA